MEEKIIYEYCLLRYVADIEREEFVNVGLMMMSKRYRWLQTRIYLDSARMEALFRCPDLTTLSRQLSIFERNDVPDRDLPVEERYRWMAAVKSACIRTSPSHPGIIPVSAPPTRAEAEAALENKFRELFLRLVK